MLTPLHDGGNSPTDIEQADFPALLAATVHDLKNSVGALLDTLNDADADAPSDAAAVAGMVDRLRHEAVHINNDLVALLAVYKIDHDRYPLHIDQHCVRDIIEECILQYTPRQQRGRIAVESRCPADLYGFFDRGLTSGIISNAVHNALRHTRDRVLIRAEAHGDGLTVAVEDNGPGYPFQLLAPGPYKGGIDFAAGSTGLGLHFAALAAGLHRNKGRGGHITLANGGSLGGGCFRLHLP